MGDLNASRARPLPGISRADPQTGALAAKSWEGFHVRNHRRLPLVAIAALAMLVAASAACTKPPGGGPSTTVPGNPEIQGKKIKYGPFTVPNINAPGKSPFAAFMPFLGATLENGMIWNQPVQNVAMPCTNCYVTSIQAGLEYADGSNANINTGMWLHHMVLMAKGQGKSDATCSSSAFSLPHFAVGGTGANTERIFASGNERTTIDMAPKDGRKFGYKVNNGDSFHLLVDLMNLNTTDKSVYLTLDYKYANGSAPGYTNVKPVWLDIAQCGTSEVPAKTGAYTLPYTWTSNFAGTLVGGGGHLHDGGTNSQFLNNGAEFCNSVAAYGTKPEYVDPGGGMDHGDGGHGHAGGMHISEMSLCPQGSTIKPGDKITLNGVYDANKYPQMVHDGKLHSVMSIGILYYAV
jgi:hypothetical protein